MPVVSQAAQLPNIRIQTLPGAAVERVDVRDMLDFADGCLQPAAIQVAPVEVFANLGEVTLGCFVVAPIGARPRIMMLDMMQIFHRFSEDPVGSIPVAILRLRRNPSGEKQSGDRQQ